MTIEDRQKYEHFYGLIERHKALVERLCMRRASGDSCYCAELRQECYISIWKHEKQISADIHPLQETMWIYWLCRNAFSRLRFLQRTHLYAPIDESMADTIATTDNLTQIRDYIESLATILNSHERRAVELMAEGYTPDEMARELGIKTPSATQLRYRIIAKLRRHYKTENKNNKQ